MRLEGLKLRLTVIKGGLADQVSSPGRDLSDFGLNSMAEGMFGSAEPGVQGTRVYREVGNVVFLHEYVIMSSARAVELKQNARGQE